MDCYQIIETICVFNFRQTIKRPQFGVENKQLNAPVKKAWELHGSAMTSPISRTKRAYWF